MEYRLFLWFQLPTIYLRFTASIIEFSIVIVSYVFQKECIHFQYVSGSNTKGLQGDILIIWRNSFNFWSMISLIIFTCDPDKLICVQLCIWSISIYMMHSKPKMHFPTIHTLQN